MYPTDQPSPASGPAVTPEPTPEAPAPRRRGRRGLKIAAAVVGTVLLVGVPSTVALVLALNRGTGDQLVRLVPANSDLYTTVLLDPPLSQKRDLQSVLERFPQINSDSKLQKQFDSAMKGAFNGSGVDWKKDVQPWLGSQVGGVVDFSNGKVAGAMLVRTTDEHAASAAMDKLRNGPSSKSDHWKSTQHGGVTEWLATGSGGSGDGGYAVFDHTLVIGSDGAIINSIIDTDQGKTPNLGTSAGYRQTLQDLPAEHLGVVYVNASSAIAALKKAMGPIDSSSTPPQLQQALDDLDAYQSLGMALSLQPNAVDLDTVTLTNPNKLTAGTRAQLDKPATRTAMLDWIPSDSFGVLASSSGTSTSGAALPLAAILGVVGLTVVGQQTSSTFNNVSDGLSATAPPGAADTAPPSDTPPSPPSDAVTQMLQQLTGPDGITQHLTGESALFVGPASTSDSLPVSAVAVIGTDDPAGMDKALQNVGGMLAPDGQGGAQWQEQKDGAITIHYLDLSTTAGLLPAYAVVDGYAVIGTDPAAVRHAVDAHRGVEDNVTTSPVFSGSEAGRATGTVFFVDLQRVLSTVEDTLGSSDRADFDKNAAPDLKPLRTFTVTGGGDDTHQTSHIVLTLG